MSLVIREWYIVHAAYSLNDDRRQSRELQNFMLAVDVGEYYL